MSQCDLDRYDRLLDLVLREDLESLSRLFTVDERVEMWNDIRKAFREYLKDCVRSAGISHELDRAYRGRFRFAMLLLAASFKVNNEGYEHITRMFREEEYQILLDFEEYKIFDNLSVDEIVVFIERRKGRVYELVREYYEKQYHVLEEKWAKLIGDMMAVFVERYRRRREKIEEAVIAYVKKHGLVQVVSEIEEAVKKILEAGELRKRIEEEVRKKLEQELGLPVLEEKLAMLEEERRRLLERLRELEEKYLEETSSKAELVAELERIKREKEEIARSHESLAERLRRAEEELAKARSLLAEKEGELERLVSEYSSNKGVVEALEAEVERLRATVRELEKRAEEYRGLLERVSSEKQALEARLGEVEAALRGESEGRLVTGEEARAYENLLVSKLLAKIGDGAVVYDPRGRGLTRITGWDEKLFYELLGESGGSSPRGRGVVLVKKKGVLRRRKDIVVEAVTVVHGDAYREKGWDARPASLAEILDLLEKRVGEAERGGYYHVLVVASPTGFTSKALDYIGGEEFYRSFTARNVTVYLVDPVTGRIVFNKGDRAARENLHIARLELDEERIAKVIRYVASREAYSAALRASPGSPFLRLDAIARATGEDPEIVRRALARLEEEGLGRVRVTKAGIVAFHYNRAPG